MEGMQNDRETMTGAEMFGQDLFSCFNELLYEYLSRNWDHIDELIELNSEEEAKTTQKENKKDHWGNLKKKYNRKRITSFLEDSRRFTTMTAILKSVGSKKKGELISNNS